MEKESQIIKASGNATSSGYLDNSSNRVEFSRSSTVQNARLTSCNTMCSKRPFPVNVNQKNTSKILNTNNHLILTENDPPQTIQMSEIINSPYSSRSPLRPRVNTRLMNVESSITFPSISKRDLYAGLGINANFTPPGSETDYSPKF
ncbi:hypothetical protein G9A89_010205 [Geosiphon pyriformis]|nr:hypothetical protein G9A89_010205 [Geosiphon pyriformis]